MELDRAEQPAHQGSRAARLQAEANGQRFACAAGGPAGGDGHFGVLEPGARDGAPGCVWIRVHNSRARRLACCMPQPHLVANQETRFGNCRKDKGDKGQTESKLQGRLPTLTVGTRYAMDKRIQPSASTAGALDEAGDNRLEHVGQGSGLHKRCEHTDD